MVSAAEQLARNISFSTFSKAKELQARIWFTLIALIVYRLGAQIPIPGIDAVEYARAFAGMKEGILGMWNTFSGGAVERMAIFALNVMPYISHVSRSCQLAPAYTGTQLSMRGSANPVNVSLYPGYENFMVLPLREVTVVVQSPSVWVGMSLRAAISGVMQTFMAMPPPAAGMGMARHAHVDDIATGEVDFGR